jgi:pyruvate dehydrogenase E2 component (dihydrolipoamide acetyltransferase)
LATFEFGFPELGEGLHEGRIARWLVKPGDAVKEDDALAEVENDKATVELPSPVDGEIQELRVKEGAVATVGEIVAVITVAASAADTGSPELAQAGLAATAQAVADPPASAPAQTVAGPPGAGQDSSAPGLVAGSAVRQAVRAAPSVRRLAREHGVDLARVKSAADDGIIRAQDVLAFVAKGMQDNDALDAAAAAVHASPDDANTADNAKTTTRNEAARSVDQHVPLSGVRRAIATAMSTSAFTAPHVTIMDEVDVTALVALREQMKPLGSERGVRLTYLPFVVKALIAAVRKYPHLNSELDDQAGELILKSGRHVGIATDTERGLFVPVLFDADRMSMWEIAAAIADRAERARAGKLALSEMKGSTISITNIGSAGGLFFTPIINYPEVAILGVGRVEKRPVVRADEVVAAPVLALSLSFDHRVIDGAMAQQAMNEIKGLLSDPLRLLMEV